MEVLYLRCCGLDVHKETVVACLRVVSGGKVDKDVRTFETTTAGLIALAEWLAENGCTHNCDGGDRHLLEASVAHLG